MGSRTPISDREITLSKVPGTGVVLGELTVLNELWKIGGVAGGVVAEGTGF
jgi:hypothetical protein